MLRRRKKWLIGACILLALMMLGTWIVLWTNYQRALEVYEKYGDTPRRYEMNPKRIEQLPDNHTVDP
jgi:hypothetical protein